MRIGLVLDELDPARGGLERWTIGFAAHLRDRGHEVHVLAFGGQAQAGITLHSLPPLRSLIGRARRIEAFLPRLALDALLDTGTGWSGDVFLPCTGSRSWSQKQLVATHPLPLRLRAALSPRSLLLAWEMGRLERAQVRRARHVIAVSSLVRNLLLRQHLVAPEKIGVIPNGVDSGRFAPQRLAGLRAPTRRALGVDDAVVFLGSAHNMRLKGMDTAIRALARIPGARLLIAGAEPDPGWRALAAPLGERVRFLGNVDEMAPLFAAADALVHPTRWDACSLSTIEAGAAGLPVITTSKNGAAELIREGVTGFVLPDPDDVEALAAAMTRLLDGELRLRMREAALADAAAHDVRANYAAVERVLLANSRAGNAPAAGPSADRDRSPA